VLDDAIAAHLKGSAGTKSEKEDAFHALVRGRPRKPIANVKVLGFEVDAYWPELRLVVEVDGPATNGRAPSGATGDRIGRCVPLATPCCASPTSRSSSGRGTCSPRSTPR
jgi:hypothetical protein